jgi:hypothetical protein
VQQYGPIFNVFPPDTTPPATVPIQAPERDQLVALERNVGLMTICLPCVGKEPVQEEHDKPASEQDTHGEAGAPRRFNWTAGMNCAIAMQTIESSSWMTTYCPAEHETVLFAIPLLLFAARQTLFPEQVMSLFAVTAAALVSTVVQTLFDTDPAKKYVF